MMTKGSMSYGMNRDDTSVSILSRIFDNGPSALLAQDAVGQLEETRRPRESDDCGVGIRVAVPYRDVDPLVIRHPYQAGSPEASVSGSQSGDHGCVSCNQRLGPILGYRKSGELNCCHAVNDVRPECVGHH